MFAPEEIHSVFISLLNDRSRPVFGQVATLDQKGSPQLRTVHLRTLPDLQSFGFSSHLQSAKCDQLRHRAILSGCYYDALKNVQWRWEGTASILDAPEFEPTRQHLWNHTRPDVRQAYWQTYTAFVSDQEKKETVKLEIPSPNFTAVLCQPAFWDLYTLDPENYGNDTRKTFRLDGNKWISQAISPLDGKVLPLV